MKIGLLTFHRAENFGAVLQCFALQHFLTRKGYDVQIVDYRNPSIEHQYDIFSPWVFSQYRSLYVGLCIYIKRFYDIKSRLRKKILYSQFRDQYFHKTRVYRQIDNPLHFDAIIVGSDQVWNLNLCKGGEQVYFLDFPVLKYTKKIAYAASSELNSFELLRNNKDKIRKLLSSFDNISVREKQLQEELKDYINQKIEVCIDPTFLESQEFYRSIAIEPKEKDYILVYHLTENSEATCLAESIAKEKNKKIVEIHAGFVRTKDKRRHKDSLGPKELLGYILNAEIIITTSFHGMALSLIFNKQFVVMRTPTVTRMQNLLSAVELNDRIIDTAKGYYKLNPIDYGKVNMNLEREIEKSKSFLIKSLKE